MAKIFFPQYAKGRKEGINLVIGKSILEHIKMIGGIEIDSECDGRGICGRDIVRIEEGVESLSDISDSEKSFLDQGKLKSNQRLACQTIVTKDNKDITVFISNFGRYTILTDTIKSDVELKPSVFSKEGKIFYHNGDNLGIYQGKIYGLAIDVGTTTLVMQIVDLETGINIGKPIASKNPQIAYGNDIISRIGYTINNKNGLKELQEVVVSGINNSLKELEKKLRVSNRTIIGNIYDVVIVGNSTMRDIFFSQNVHDLGVIPFESLNKDSITKKASQMGLKVNPNAFVYSPPLIGGHAGADCLADIIATKLYKNPETAMLIDIGTNGEVVVGNKDKIITASCAAGGAYEGYQISCGVGAIEGAITKLKIENSHVKYETLGNKPPLGVCGSGVIDLLAELSRNSIMNERTRINEDFYITDNISISQNDINQLIIAKAGLRTDQDLLIKYYGTSLYKIDKIYLTGAFGNYMNIENAMDIGLLPKTSKDKFIRFGNGALAGAIDMLLSKEIRNDAENLRKLIEHKKPNEIEGKKFQYIVAENMYFSIR